MDLREINTIYALLVDEASKSIFGKRLLLSATGDRCYLYQMLREVPDLRYLCSVAQLSRENIVFGAGYYAHQLIGMVSGYWLGVVDNNQEKWGTQMEGVDVLPPDIINRYPTARIFVCTRKPGHRYQDEIVRQLRNMGVTEERIIRVDRILEKMERKQYFDLPEMAHDSQEVFVDGGAYDGDTIERFANWSGAYAHIYAFEPDEENGEACRQRIGQQDKITVFSACLGRRNGTVCFTDSDGVGSRIDAHGSMVVPVVSLDEALNGKRVTFIKLDIEGAELDTLQGAEKLLCSQRPKLAICVYHKPEDIISIPMYIASLNLGYRFYLRHYGLGNEETVLYCV